MTKTKPLSIKQYTFEELLEQDGFLVYTNVGVSMLPLLRQKRDIIEIHAKGEERCKKYDVVLYKRNEKYILHRIIKVRADDYIIAGDNCFGKESGINDDQILGIMTKVIRDGKVITLDDIKYRIYSHLWVDLYPFRATILYFKRYLFFWGHKIKKALKE